MAATPLSNPQTQNHKQKGFGEDAANDAVIAEGILNQVFVLLGFGKAWNYLSGPLQIIK